MITPVAEGSFSALMQGNSVSAGCPHLLHYRGQPHFASRAEAVVVSTVLYINPHLLLQGNIEAEQRKREREEQKRVFCKEEQRQREADEAEAQRRADGEATAAKAKCVLCGRGVKWGSL